VTFPGGYTGGYSGGYTGGYSGGYTGGYIDPILSVPELAHHGELIQ